MILECFQTVEDQDNIDYIEKYGPFKCTRTDAWLGEGYYLWDSNIEWAHSWGNVYKANGYIVCQVSVRHDGHIFDLWGNVSHQAIFKGVLNRLSKQTSTYPTVPEVITAMQKLNLFPYKAIRSADEPDSIQTLKYNKNRREELIIGQRVQICLLDKNNPLSHTFRIVFPEKYVF